MLQFNKFNKIPIKHYIFKNNVHCAPTLPQKDGKQKCEEAKGENVKKCLFIPRQVGNIRPTRKVSLIGGAGHVGLAIAHNLTITNFCDEMILADTPEQKDKLYGNYLDLCHCKSDRRGPKISTCTNGERTKNSDLLIISSGVGSKKGQSCRDLISINAKIFKDLIPKYTKLSPDSVILVVANPTDILTYLAWKYSGFPINRVISTGTELDCARFRYHISKRLGINHRSVHGWIVGEHGESCVPVWSGVNVVGTTLRDIDPKIGDEGDENEWNVLHKQVVADGGMILAMKGKSEWGISFATEHIARSVLCNAHKIHAVSTQIKGLYGVCTDAFLSFPCVVGNRGVHSIVHLHLDDKEIENLNKSACILDQTIKSLKI